MSTDPIPTGPGPDPSGPTGPTGPAGITDTLQAAYDALVIERDLLRADKATLEERLRSALDGDLKAALHKSDIFERGFKKQSALNEELIAGNAALREEVQRLKVAANG